ncbi:hypothetical protein TRIP_C20129 [Candidatus Zixiibacteriota bacterium]|nr:hypothetical protein TRIP_C20129 [candidate division Zixibacteria bacterium]
MHDIRGYSYRQWGVSPHKIAAFAGKTMSYKGNKNGVPKGIRTPVTAVKGRCPRPG